MKTPPTGIIRTLPSLYTDPKNPGYRGLQRSVARCERDESAYFYIALAQQPKHQIIHLYLLVGNQITHRFNVVGYAPGFEANCWDKTIRNPKLWVICTGPVSRPPEPIRRRGFQGFRYTEDLW
jgi:hypothetical protein